MGGSRKNFKIEELTACFMMSVTGSVVKNPPANTRDSGLIPELGRSPGEGNSNPLQYSCPRNPMDRGAWWAIAHGITKRVRHDLATTVH